MSTEKTTHHGDVPIRNMKKNSDSVEEEKPSFSDGNRSEVVFSKCDRGRGIRVYFPHTDFHVVSFPSTHQPSNHLSNDLNTFAKSPTTESLDSTETTSKPIETAMKSDGKAHALRSISFSEEKQNLSPQQHFSPPEQSNEENEKNRLSLLNISMLSEYQIQQAAALDRNLSRLDIEAEIKNMIENIVSAYSTKTNQPLLIGDAHCHLDILFDQLKCPNQSVDSYLFHNGRIYENGVDMSCVIQAFFAPTHFHPRNWENTYSKYLKNKNVYGKIGLHPLFAHHLDFELELRIRKCLSNSKIVAVGEIGLDYETPSRPSNDAQIRAFSQQIRLAQSRRLPIVIHSRASFVQVLEILSQELPSDYPICWRNFNYDQEELNMLLDKFNNVYLSCSPLVFINRKIRKIIEYLPINMIIPESVAPHLTIPQCPNAWLTHPIFVCAIYQYISTEFQLPIEKVTKQLVTNIKDFFLLE